MTALHTPIVLVVLDGWGLSNDYDNILRTTELPTITRMSQYYPFAALQASGIAVGIPWGDAGNSEVGHITMGAGRILYQSLPRISLAIQSEEFYSLPAFLNIINTVKASGGTLHLMGLVSKGAVHAHYDHLIALLELAKRNDIADVAVHVFTDGRDSAPTSGVAVIEKLLHDMARMGVGRIASICGRHIAMDRNNNWDRTVKAYDMLTNPIASNTAQITDIIAYMRTQYEAQITDEFMSPAVVVDDTNTPTGIIKDNDGIIFFNFREDRARQLTKALATSDEFTGFVRNVHPNITMATMTEYEKGLPVDVVFSSQEVVDTLGEILSKNNKTQLRIAETEKYAHVTYFFNGGREDAWEGEDHILVPSPTVARFSDAPEMSAAIITEKIVADVEARKHDFILVNYANADMVGHTGNEDACREAVRAIDKTLSILIPSVLSAGGALLITADHGNVENLRNEITGSISTEHTVNPVPLWYITAHNEFTKPRNMTTAPPVIGLLSDIAPTVLALFDIPKPAAMHGQNLLPFLK